jgi:hypothetical protein
MGLRSWPGQSVWALGLAVCGANALGCGGAPAIGVSAELGKDAIVAVYRSPEAQAVAMRQTALAASGGGTATTSTERNFYLAIRKDQLATRWFLDVAMERFYPGGVAILAGKLLGSSVVSFKIQNDKLFMFNADNRTKMSDTFAPEVVIDAFPIVHGFRPFEEQPGAGEYVLFDPAAGLHHFGVISDQFAGSAEPAHFQVDLTFVEHFRKLADGVAFKQTFTGYLNDHVFGFGVLFGEGNAFRLSGVLAFGLHRYREGEGFKPMAPPEMDPRGGKEYFFRSPVRLVPDTGKATQSVMRWNIHPGMKPIEWYISYRAKQAEQDPLLKGIDIVGTLKRGIESWNQALGYPIVHAQLAGPEDNLGDMDKNFVLWDDDVSMTSAYAMFLANPNTGEIHQAGVYLPRSWLTNGFLNFGDEPPRVARGGELAKAPFSFVWGDMRANLLCQMAPAHGFASGFEPYLRQLSPPSDSHLTKRDRAALRLESTIRHEIGHTLGLRHNFRGSLKTPTSSVMDYIPEEYAIEETGPGSYDVDALKLLYGQTEEEPKQPFCDDTGLGGANAGPDCAQYDYTADPFGKLYAPAFERLAEPVIEFGAENELFDRIMNRAFDFVRSGTTKARAAAFKRLFARVAPPVARERLTRPGSQARLDELTRRMIARLFLDSADARSVDGSGLYSNDPALDEMPVIAEVFPLLRQVLLNSDGIRSFGTRRTVVDVLKKVQSAEALRMLIEAQDHLAMEKMSLSGAALLEADDLITRIRVATHPYYPTLAQ